MALSVEAFDSTKLALISSLDCGSDDFGKVATDWIKCVDPSNSALQSIQDRQTLVFLYFDDGQLVGFGSVGLTNRKIDKQPEECSVIPHIGVDRNHSRKGYGTKIMLDLIARAADNNTRRLILFVNVDNHNARKLYESLGFVTLDKPNSNGIQPMFVMLG